jgi:hypothetical protein
MGYILEMLVGERGDYYCFFHQVTGALTDEYLAALGHTTNARPQIGRSPNDSVFDNCVIGRLLKEILMDGGLHLKLLLDLVVAQKEALKVPDPVSIACAGRDLTPRGVGPKVRAAFPGLLA